MAMAQSPSSDARFRRLFDQHEAAMRTYCKRRLNIHDANDAVADIFVTAWRKIDTVPAGDEARLWLYGVARNAVRNAQRSTRRRSRLAAKAGSVAHNPGPSPEEVVVRRAADRRVLEAMDQLKPEDREALRLHLWEELPHADVGKVLGISPDAARIRVSRAKKRMARALKLSNQVPTRPRAVEEEGG
jgi:RNA polymerase sigma-70 factor (ECF subfamily)